jgi:FkbM family methyltransferase
MKIFLYKVLNKLKLAKAVNFTLHKTVNQVNFKIPVIYQIGFEHSTLSEIWMIDILSKITTIKEGTFYDVGVNTGQTLIKLKAVNTTMPYLGFEPNPKCIFYVDELIKANGFKNCELIPIGLMNENALLQLSFYSDTETDQAASMVEDFRPDAKTFYKKYVPAFNYTTLKLTKDVISILKIDVEGAELFVIEALKQKIITDRPIILMEILPCHSDAEMNRIERQQKMEAIFIENKYKLYRVIKGTTTVQLQYIPKIEIHSNIELCEYMIVPNELEETITTKFKVL